MTCSLQTIAIALAFQLVLGAVPDAGAEVFTHHRKLRARQMGDPPHHWRLWIWVAVATSAGVGMGLLAWVCFRYTRQSYRRIPPLDESNEDSNSSGQLGCLTTLLQHKAVLLTKGLASTAFRALDLTLDITTGIKFYRTGDKWWSSLTFAVILLSPLPQYLYVKMQRGWGAKAIGYLVPGSVAHIYKEILYLRFLQKLPQSALVRNVHKMVGGSAMNEVLAGLECAFESLPQGCLQLRAYSIKGGNWINVLSIASSLAGVAMGIFFAYKALMRKEKFRGFGFGSQGSFAFADGQVMQLQRLEMDSETQGAILWLAAHDEDYKIWNLSRTNAHDGFLKELAQKRPGITAVYLQKCKAVTNAGVQELAERSPGLTSIDLGDTGITDTAVLELAQKCSGLASVNLSYCREITDAAVQELAQKCSGLDAIFLKGCVRITDASTQAMALNLPGLQTVDLDLTQITDASVLSLARGCPGLSCVSLTRNHISDAAVQELARKCPKLTDVTLDSCLEITDVAVRELAQECQGLKNVCLRRTHITDAAVQELAQKCPGLTEMDLYYTAITDAALQELAQNCPGLISLNLSNTAVTDVAVQELVPKCPRLTYLGLISCHAITHATVQELRQKHPSTQFAFH